MDTQSKRDDVHIEDKYFEPDEEELEEERECFAEVHTFQVIIGLTPSVFL